MIDYYRILGLTLAKSKNTITDDMVRRNFLAKKQQYEKMMQNNKGKELKSNYTASIEVQAMIDGDYLDLIEDAYYALATENSRKHYDELSNELNKHIEEQKSKNKLYADSAKNNLKGQINNMVHTANNGELLEEIKKRAREKYPITQENKRNDDEIDL
jgi:hypothetical protein